ncbi:unnamed protein product, partial [Rotaria socialis]
ENRAVALNNTSAPTPPTTSVSQPTQQASPPSSIKISGQQTSSEVTDSTTKTNTTSIIAPHLQLPSSLTSKTRDKLETISE